MSRLTVGHDFDQFLTSTNWIRTLPADQMTIFDVMETNTDTRVEMCCKRNSEYFAFILPSQWVLCQGL